LADEVLFVSRNRERSGARAQPFRPQVGIGRRTRSIRKGCAALSSGQRSGGNPLGSLVRVATVNEAGSAPKDIPSFDPLFTVRDILGVE
jgi:hypothetical protein